jgi:hypothetical protein
VVSRTQVSHPVRACATCSRTDGVIIQYVQHNDDGSWTPFLAHKDCVGSESAIACKPVSKHHSILRKATVAALAVLVLGACSQTETVYMRDGVCYDRSTGRVWGIQTNTEQSQVDRKYCP